MNQSGRAGAVNRPDLGRVENDGVLPETASKRVTAGTDAPPKVAITPMRLAGSPCNTTHGRYVDQILSIADGYIMQAKGPEQAQVLRR